MSPVIRPSTGSVVGSVVGRTSAIERRRPNEQRRPVEEVPFSFAGAIAVSTSPRWYSRTGGKLIRVIASLATAGTANTVVTVFRNDGSIGTITLASGETFKSVAFDVAFNGDSDHLRIGVTTAGAGAKDLTVQGRFA